ncbi:MAG: hypothetical protein LQ343_003784 [Gyalolechia ehrenbergii]|nr:MAG: hypothetical protein LQ343_003784 [Gyalolechia ehrenbergii]
MAWKYSLLRELHSQSIGLPWLLHSLRKLEHLEQLSIRCKDVVADNSSEVIWPPRLKALCVTGTFSDAVLDHFLSLPKALTSLTLYECRKLTLQPVKSLIKVLRDSLESLHVGRLKIQSEREDLVKWLEDLPRLKRLHACASWSFIPDDKPYYLSTSNFGTDNPHPLEYLEFDCSGVTESNDHEWGEIKYDLFWNLIDEGFLGNLRHVNWYHRRGVHLSKHATRIVRELDELLQALAREDGENARIKEEDAGAYIIWV